MTTGTPTRRASTTTLDYYVLHSEADDGQPAGLLVEEFLLGDDLSATRLRSAGWTPADGGWWSSAAFARALRTDPRLRARLAATDRPTAEAVHRRLGGGPLPDEETLRGHFRDDVPLASAAPLRLGAGPVVHRVLFAGELDSRQVELLGAALRLGAARNPDVTRPGVVSTGRLRVNDTNFRWDLRRVGGGVAWCVDVTSEPAGDDALRWLLRQLVGLARRHGLVPATIDRLS
ncbi:hypothetical protein ABGB16_11870 [Micromonospora sp. B11E3]|uniref:hypothetical protein n=1 Tax=Micromonospora sp. B11E3 TaxID=3153562 RepID=UPI00325DBD8D